MTHTNDIKAIEERLRDCEYDIGTIKTDLKHGEKRMCEISDAIKEGAAATTTKLTAMELTLDRVICVNRMWRAIRTWLLVAVANGITGTFIYYLTKGGEI